MGIIRRIKVALADATNDAMWWVVAISSVATLAIALATCYGLNVQEKHNYLMTRPRVSVAPDSFNIHAPTDTLHLFYRVINKSVLPALDIRANVDFDDALNPKRFDFMKTETRSGGQLFSDTPFNLRSSDALDKNFFRDPQRKLYLYFLVRYEDELGRSYALKQIYLVKDGNPNMFFHEWISSE
jgi:hypothetical protein